MATDLKILCDGCGRDITYNEGGYPHQWSYHLTWKDAPRNPDEDVSSTFALYMPTPNLKGKQDFCSMNCLKKVICS